MPLVKHIYSASKQISAAISPGANLLSQSLWIPFWGYQSCLLYKIFELLVLK
jgi:uncharacterized membrane protein